MGIISNLPDYRMYHKQKLFQLLTATVYAQYLNIPKIGFLTQKSNGPYAVRLQSRVNNQAAYQAQPLDCSNSSAKEEVA